MSDMQENKEVEETPAVEEETPVVEEEKKKRFKWWFIPVGILGTALLVYLGFAIYFMNHFYYNTTISGMDSSAKSIEAVIGELEHQAENYVLAIEKSNGTTETITSEAISLSHNLGSVLEDAMDKQNAFLWITSLFQDNKTEIKLDMNYNEEQLKVAIENLDCMKPENQQEAVSAIPVFNGSAYEIQKEVPGTEIDVDKFNETIRDSINCLEPVIIMAEQGCYKAPTFTSESEEVKEALELANKYAASEITYDVANNETIVNAKKIAKWISFTDEMKVKLNNEAMEKFVYNIAKKYNTVGKERKIVTPTGKKATVEGGTYGRSVDRTKELAKLKKNIKNGAVVTREPVYSQKTASSGKYEWGKTYLEVDITEQHMWYIKKGKVVFETDVVTGSPAGGRSTPQGVYSILEKMRNKILRGEIQANGEREYETPVSYWMRVTWSGIGFHDATWQPVFGGQRYKQGFGSHGCINMPLYSGTKLSGISELYDMVEKGCPVIIHY